MINVAIGLNFKTKFGHKYCLDDRSYWRVIVGTFSNAAGSYNIMKNTAILE
jgi:hypothetical protein